MSNNKPSIGDFIADGLAAFGSMLFIFGIIGGLWWLRVTSLQDTAKRFEKEAHETHYIIGQVAKVESWQTEDKIVLEKTNTYVATLDSRDLFRVTFVDGRSKEFIGLPQEPIPTDKEVAIVYSKKHNFFIEVVDAAKFKERLEAAVAEKPEEE